MVGREFPAADVGHEMLESAKIIRQLWRGKDMTICGTHLTVEDARLVDLPAAGVT